MRRSPIEAAAAMTEGQTTRRRILQQIALMAYAALPFRSALAQRSAGRVVVIGGGCAGATCARALKRLDPRLGVTLVEQSAIFTACPFSNEVIAGLRDLRDQQFTYDKLAGSDVDLARQMSIGT